MLVINKNYFEGDFYEEELGLLAASMMLVASVLAGCAGGSSEGGSGKRQSDYTLLS